MQGPKRCMMTMCERQGLSAKTIYGRWGNTFSGARNAHESAKQKAEVLDMKRPEGVEGYQGSLKGLEG